MMEASRVQTLVLLLSLYLPGGNASSQKPHDDAHKISVTTVQSKAVTVTRKYVGQIHSRRHIVIQSLTEGNLTAILIKDGQTVKKGDLLFQVTPTGKDKPEDKDKFASITAPFGGLIGRMQVPLGGPVKEGTGLVTLSDNSEMWFFQRAREAVPGIYGRASSA